MKVKWLISLQVQFPSEILSLEKNTLQTGRGFETEITCVVTGEPQPRVMWYKDGQILNITSHSRTEYQRAGSKHILIIHNTQGSDFGTYMCYATNSIGGEQEMVEVSANDRSDSKLKYGDSESEGDQSASTDSEAAVNFKTIKKQLERHRRIVAGFRQKIEKEIKLLQTQVNSKINSRGDGSFPASGSGSDFYLEIGKFFYQFLFLIHMIASFQTE